VLFYANHEGRPLLPYSRTNPRVRNGAQGFARLLEGLQRGSKATNLAEWARAERDCLLQCGAAGWRLDPQALSQALGPRVGIAWPLEAAIPRTFATAARARS
jgi:hypothetical protein